MKDNALPCLIHCTHGKDRTGVIIMLLLLLCNVPTEVFTLCDTSNGQVSMQVPSSCSVA